MIVVTYECMVMVVSDLDLSVIVASFMYRYPVTTTWGLMYTRLYSAATLRVWCTRGLSKNQHHAKTAAAAVVVCRKVVYCVYTYQGCFVKLISSGVVAV